MKLLLLGGTGEAKQMAARLHQRGVDLIYSVAGLVRQPQLACPVVSGGFSQRGGLQQFIEQQGIAGILDMTHPYAEQMTQTATQIAEQLALPYWRYQRPAWRPASNDQWHYAASYQTLWPTLAGQKSVLWTSGQLPSWLLAAMTAERSTHHVVRTAVAPSPSLQPLPEHITWIEAIGPFSLAQERALLMHHQVTALVSKDSGGKTLASKMMAARQLQLPVFLLARPSASPLGQVFEELENCEHFITQHFLAAE